MVEVQGERGLGEPWSVADRERLAEDLQVGVTVTDQAAGQIGPVDVELAEGDLLGVQVGGDLGGDLGLCDVGGGHADRTDQLGVQVGQHVALVAVDPDALGLAAVAHLGILDRDPPILGHPLADPHHPIGADHGVLVADLPGRGQPPGHDRVLLTAKLGGQPFHPADRGQHHPQRLLQRSRVIPVQI